MGIQVVGEKKRRRCERDTGLPIDRLVRLDNWTWEARVLVPGGHRHVEIDKHDWTVRMSSGSCWSTCGDLPDESRKRLTDVPLRPYAWAAE